MVQRPEAEAGADDRRPGSDLPAETALDHAAEDELLDGRDEHDGDRGEAEQERRVLGGDVVDHRLREEIQCRQDHRDGRRHRYRGDHPATTYTRQDRVGRLSGTDMSR